MTWLTIGIDTGGTFTAIFAIDNNVLDRYWKDLYKYTVKPLGQ
jgi:N-methylhydantoinase A/oxoprolinase/acetone carboxylase beta subunit